MYKSKSPIDTIDGPDWYALPMGGQLEEVIGHLPFNVGSAIKYAYRAGNKDPAKHLVDLNKAKGRIEKEIHRITVQQARLTSKDTSDDTNESGPAFVFRDGIFLFGSNSEADSDVGADQASAAYASTMRNSTASTGSHSTVH